MNNNKHVSTLARIIGFVFGLMCLGVMAIFVMGIIKLSLQDGTSSTTMTNAMAMRLGKIIFDETPDANQLMAMNRILRFTAHFMLFAILGYGAGIVSMILFRTTIMREIGIIFDLLICGALSYYTEYYKQFVDGRHFQMEDVRINFCGSLVGICFLIFSAGIFAIVHARSK